MKSTFLKRISMAAALCAVILPLTPGLLQAQKVIAPLNPQLENLASPGSSREWLQFRQGTKINPRTFFNDMKDAFNLTSNDRMQMLREEKDNIGFTHFRYQQFYKNIPVLYAEYAIHQQRDEFVKSANGHIVNRLNNLASNPSLSERTALTNALQFMGAKKYLWDNPVLEKELKRQSKDDNATYYPKGRLVYAPANYKGDVENAKYRLAWEFAIYPDESKVPARKVYVDAVAGTIVHSVDISMNCSGASGTSAFNGTVSFSTDLSGSSYLSHNNCQSTDIYVYNCNGGGLSNTYYTDADNSWTQQSAVQAQWGALQTYNYYLGQHSRSSWDNASGDLIAYNNSNVPSLGLNNACWGCAGNNAIFGAGSTSSATDDWNTNDIMGHEFTHGVTQSSAGLVYSYESGALNESFSDIFGEMVESWSEGNCDYLVGADRGAIRSFINPNTYYQPDTYLGTYWYTGTADNGGVHTNSGVQNRWFYLLSEGGSGTTDFGIPYNVTGISRFTARLIAYRALTVYLNSSSQYIDARKATLQAAYDLYGQCSREVIAVGDAWHAVGVESQSTNFTKNACGSYPAAGTFMQAIAQLTAANGCTTTITASSTPVYFTARDRVILYPGFRAVDGSRFTAYLEPCSSSMWGSERSSVIKEDSLIVKSDPEKGIFSHTFEKLPDAVMTDSKDGITITPNPFHTTFDVVVSSSKDDRARISLLNAAGLRVKELQGVSVSKGSSRITFEAAALPAGVYMVEIIIGDVRTIKKVVKL